jgi:hypothetical protein
MVSEEGKAVKLSEHFTLEEMTISETGARLGKANDPNDREIENLKTLCSEILEPLRSALCRPVGITSGYRSPEINKLVGGSTTSQHVFGQAADIHVSGMTAEELFLFATEKVFLPFDQIIQEFNQWVHISYRSNPRGQKLRATHENGLTHYTTV